MKGVDKIKSEAHKASLGWFFVNTLVITIIMQRFRKMYQNHQLVSISKAPEANKAFLDSQ